MRLCALAPTVGRRPRSTPTTHSSADIGEPPVWGENRIAASCEVAGGLARARREDPEALSVAVSLGDLSPEPPSRFGPGLFRCKHHFQTLRVRYHLLERRIIHVVSSPPAARGRHAWSRRRDARRAICCTPDNVTAALACAPGLGRASSPPRSRCERDGRTGGDAPSDWLDTSCRSEAHASAPASTSATTTRPPSQPAWALPEARAAPPGLVRSYYHGAPSSAAHPKPWARAGSPGTRPHPELTSIPCSRLAQ